MKLCLSSKPEIFLYFNPSDVRGAFQVTVTFTPPEVGTSTVSPKSPDSEFIGSTFATIFVGEGITSSLSGIASVGTL